MLVVYKYPLEVTGEQQVLMPVGARVLTVQVQYDQPCLWALVETRNPLANCTVTTVGTGHPTDLTTGSTYVGTYQLKGGALVMHVFM